MNTTKEGCCEKCWSPAVEHTRGNHADDFSDTEPCFCGGKCGSADCPCHKKDETWESRFDSLVRDICSTGFAVKSEVRTRLGIIIAAELLKQRKEQEIEHATLCADNEERLREDLARDVEGLQAICTKQHTRLKGCGARKYNKALSDAATFIREHKSI